MLPSCQIVAVHPSDERAPWLVDQYVQVPLFNKNVKIIQDEAVDPLFGSGLVMICTIGDKEDLNWVFKYKLPIEICIDEEGKMNDICGKYQGLKIEDARKQIIQDLEKNQILLNKTSLNQNVGVCWRCKTPVEFINTEQWFLKTVEFKDLVLQQSNNMHWFPEFMKIRLEAWVESLEWDWVISRQRYFATPIPLWECKECGEVVIARPEDCYVDPTKDKPPLSTCPKCKGSLIGCEDVFDTWMDSSISPLYNTFWQRDSELFEKLYPMSVRPQAHDIIRTWAFYTILRCTLITEEKPFENIMMGGFILSEDGTPMHASLGNVIDPLKIIDEYGSDSFRCYAASCSLGEDNPFRLKDVIRGTKLLRKLWNVQQFIGNVVQKKQEQKPQELLDIDKWILSKYSKLIKKCEKQMDVFDYSQTMRDIEFFLWHEFADHYIEMIKSSIYEQKNVESITYTLSVIGRGVLQLFSPFIPFITEEIYQNQYNIKNEYESIHLTQWPLPIFIDETVEEKGEWVKNYISQVRSWKSEQGIALNAIIPTNATYASEEIISKINSSKSIIQSTLKYPDNHKFIVGKPDVEERIVSVMPVFSTLGPAFGKQSKIIIHYLKENQGEVINTISKQGDISLCDIKELNSSNKEGLRKNGYIQVKKESMVKGKNSSKIIPFDGFYLEVKQEQ
ncbi:MAG: class I tRNA ligase family protein [Thermoplasmatota archaeon]